MNKKIVSIGIATIFIIMGLTTASSLEIKNNLNNSGNTIYVDDDNIDGPWDGTAYHPYRYIQDAVDASNDYDTVFIKSGTYTKNVKINKSINLIGENLETTILNIKDYSNTQFTDAIAVNEDYVTIENLTITNADTSAITFRYFGPQGYGKGNNCTINNCYFYNNNVAIYSFIDGIDDGLISNCIIENSDLGISLGSQTGFPTGDLSNWVITDCIIRHTTGGYYSHGIVVRAASSNVLISNCEIYDAEYGILSYSGQWIQNQGWIPVKNIEVDNCNIFSCKNGINMNCTYDSIIKNCYIMNNDIGIKTDSSTDNNKIYSNKFINNDQNAKNKGNNKWDNDYPSGGNYWSDYTGLDEDNDGIGDTPYYINDNAVDNYPLVCDIDNFAPLKPTITGPTSGKINEEHTYIASCIDPDGNDIQYLFDWGDDSDSGWQSTPSAQHTWSEKSNYEIRVKAKDSMGAESDWSEPLEVEITSKSKALHQFSFLQRLIKHFPFLSRLFTV